MQRLLLLLLCAVLLITNSWAGQSSSVISQKVYQKISDYQALIDAGTLGEALTGLQEMRTDDKLNGYELSYVLNMMGFIYYREENTQQALEVFKEALAIEDIPYLRVRSTMTTVVQILLMTEQYADAEKYAEKLVTVVGTKRGDKPVPPESWILLGQSRVALEKYQDALEPLLKGINMNRERGAEPRENWLALLASVYFNIEKFDEMREVYYELIELFPREQYLMTLAALHGQLGEQGKQLALVESLLDADKLTQEQHLTMVANLFIAEGVPVKSAKLLEKELASGRVSATERNYRSLSQAWFLAGEEQKALAPLKKAAELSSDAELWLRLARLNMSLYDWNAAYAAAVKAEQADKIDDIGSVYLLQGMALAKSEDYDGATRALNKAAEYKGSSKSAEQWLQFVKYEKQRDEALQVQ